MKLFLTSLGCDKNLVDSEEMTGLLSERGITFTDQESEAEVIIVNTCAFIGDAKEESIQTILSLAEYKTQAGNGGKCRALIVCGCLGQRYQEEVLKELPEVDAVVGTMAYPLVASAIDRVLSGEKGILICEAAAGTKKPGLSGKRILSTGGHYAFLKIAEGCDKRCTYCIIPYLRGGYRSYPMEELVKEAERLAELGVKELILIAQETTVYGLDLYGEKKLPALLKELAGIEGIRWLRLMYCYPEEITEELIDTIRTEPKVCHYLDIPIQHVSDRILRNMGRKTDASSIGSLIERLRKEIPDIAIRTTLITGFPGETEEDFRTLYNFVDETEFERLGVFPYSEEEGTKAAELADQVPQEVRESRRDEIMLLQQEIAFDRAKEQLGRRLTVFVEGKLADEDVYVGRTYMDAPDVDGLLFFTSDRDYMSGDFARVVVTGAKDYDLIGETEHESSE
ncbi:MAG: 30S ribosomal protein S12 methylthiotransferase RimO [Lachnospiraceae bacterium]|nr:30S ribosomal protein S12 methylthiotransferase RimO [Lachnospiraceae bacterium]